MKQNNKKAIKTGLARVLLGVYFAFWLSLSSHYFFAHGSCEHEEGHETTALLTALPDDDTTALHAPLAADDDCSLCQIAPTLAEIPVSAFVLPTIQDFPKPEPVFGYIGLSSFQVPAQAQPRAPPIV
jgi:hypothetical protein